MTDRQTTHAPGCWSWGPRHYECALGQILRQGLRDREREQRDEALLRQALEVLEGACQVAMEQAMKARVPECGEFAEIAQDLDFVVTVLRERLRRGSRAMNTDIDQGE